ncbi:MAG: PAS domain-containing protein [Alphaproteobacteria bacterium]|nr:PAS domain-containing protein [Alphaproteobacteria bacterium]
MTDLDDLSPFSVEEVGDDNLQALYTFWESLRGDRDAPMKGDLDPLAIPRSLLPQIALFDIEWDPDRVKLRLVGTQITTWFGKDCTGLYLDDPAYYPIGQQQLPYFLQVARTLRPHYLTAYAPDNEQKYRNFARLLMPLQGDSGRSETLLAGYAMLPFDANRFVMQD